MNSELDQLEAKIREKSAFIDEIYTELNKVIVGQRYMIDRLLIGLLADGHVLLEGVPGLAKTLTVSSLEQVLHGPAMSHTRMLQWTPGASGPRRYP